MNVMMRSVMVMVMVLLSIIGRLLWLLSVV